MALNRERITLNPYEESFNNIPLELGGDRWGHGISIQPQGSQWPVATVTPQLAQSVDTEGALAAATTVGTKNISLKIQVIEPTDPATVNYLTDPQFISSYGTGTIGSAGIWSPQSFATGIYVLARDLVGMEYAALVSCQASANTGIGSTIQPVPTQNVPYTAGVWLKGLLGGEQVTISLEEQNLGSATNQTVTLTTSWQWFTVTRSNWTTGTGAQLFLFGNPSSATTFYVGGAAIVQASTLTEYFDGSFPGCAWSGAPNNSTSTRPSSGGPRMDAIMADIEASVESISRYRTGTARRTHPNSAGANTRATYDLIGAQVNWDDTSMMNAGVAQGTITLVAEPYARGPEMTTILDKYAVFVATNYTMDNGLASDFSIFSSSMDSGSTNLTTEHRFIYTGGEYPLYSGEVSSQFTPAATISGWKGGVVTKRSSASTYLEAYVTDNGTNSILNLDKLVSGTRTNVATATLGARIVNGTSYVIRVRVQRQNNNDYVYVEYFANATDPIPATAAPTNALGPYTVTDAAFSSLIPSTGGVVVTPQASNAKFTALRISPYLARERTLPVLRFGLAGVPGSAPALGRMIVQDDSGNDQYWMKWGQQHERISRMSSSTDLFYEAESLTPLNGAVTAALTGASGTGNNTVHCTKNLTTVSGGAVQVPVISTGALGHIGDFQIFARVASGAATTWQLQWSVGDFESWTTNTPSAANYNYSYVTGTQFNIVNLGAIHVPTVTSGTQQWQGIFSVAPTFPLYNASVYIDCIWLVPLGDGAGQVSGTEVYPISSNYVTLDPLSNYGATTALNGQTPSIGSAWATSGATTDFTENAGQTGMQRTTVSDSTFRYAVSGSAQTNSAAQVSFTATNFSATNYALLLRWTNSSNYLQVFAVLAPPNPFTIVLSKTIAGAGTTIGEVIFTTTPTSNTIYTLQAMVDSDGRVFVFWGPGLSPTFVMAVQDPALATGGALASGQAGFADANGASANTRTYFNFSSAAFTPDAAFYAGQQLEIRSDRANRLNSGGTIWTPPSSYIGQYLKVPNDGSQWSDQVSNIIIKASRNDAAALNYDTGIDAIEAQVNITPRYANISDL